MALSASTAHRPGSSFWVDLPVYYPARASAQRSLPSRSIPVSTAARMRTVHRRQSGQRALLRDLLVIRADRAATGAYRRDRFRPRPLQVPNVVIMDSNLPHQRTRGATQAEGVTGDPPTFRSSPYGSSLRARPPTRRTGGFPVPDQAHQDRRARERPRAAAGLVTHASVPASVLAVGTESSGEAPLFEPVLDLAAADV